MSEKMNYVYILQCSDNTLYTGWTNDISQRLATHNAGRGAKYTRCRLPVTLVYCETQPSRSLAMQREAAIKKLTRKEKLQLIAEKTLVSDHAKTHEDLHNHSDDANNND